MTAAFAFEVTIVVRCGHCSAETAVPVGVPAGGRVPEPVLPQGWRVLDYLPLCPAHRIVVDTEFFSADRQLVDEALTQLERECPGVGDDTGYWQHVARPRLTELLEDLLGRLRPQAPR